MPRRRLNRREALGLGAAAVAGGALRPALRLRRGHLAVRARDRRGRARTSRAGAPRAVLQAPRRFDLMGLRWKRGGQLDAQVRARRRGGSWSPWMPLHAAGDHAPDGARAPAGTEPAYTGAADVFQLRLRGSARGLRARFVRAQPTARTARHVTGRLRARKRRPRARKSQSGQPAIISRTEWGGDSVPPRAAPRVRRGAGRLRPPHGQHERLRARGLGGDRARDRALPPRLQPLERHRLQLPRRPVRPGVRGPRGRDRPGRDRRARPRATTPPSTGIACIGTFTSVPQSEPGMDALARLIGWKLSLHAAPTQGTVVVTSRGGSANRYPSGAPVTLERISGHRDGDSTSCPGETLYTQLPDLRARAGALRGPARRDHGARGQPAHPHAAGRALGRAALPRRLLARRRAARRSSSRCPARRSRTSPTRSARPTAPGRRACRWPPAARSAPPSSATPRARRSPPPRSRSACCRCCAWASPPAACAPAAPSPSRAPCRRSRPPGRVEVRVERRVGRRWARVQRKRINVRGGRFLTRLRMRRAGLYRVSVLTPGATQRRLLRVR